MKYPLLQIEPIALLLWKQLKPYCKIIKIAGSVRRRKDECKDIEIVLLPTDRSSRNKIGMFFIQNAKIIKGKFTGRYVKAVYKGYPVDVFIPQSHDYYRQLAIRTGSAEYAKKIATAWCEKGYVGTSDGLVEVSKQSEFVSPKTWTTEREFFNWLGMPYLEPKDRM